MDKLYMATAACAVMVLVALGGCDNENEVIDACQAAVVEAAENTSLKTQVALAKAVSECSAQVATAVVKAASTCSAAPTCSACKECPKEPKMERVGPDQLVDMRSGVKCMYASWIGIKTYRDKTKLHESSGDIGFNEVVAVVGEDSDIGVYKVVLYGDVIAYVEKADLTRNPLATEAFLSSANHTTNAMAWMEAEKAAKEKLAAAKTPEERTEAQEQMAQAVHDFQFRLRSYVPELCKDWVHDMRSVKKPE